MRRDEYFKFMLETSKFVSPVIEKYIETFKVADKELYDSLMLFSRRRLYKPLLKPTLLRLSYEICGGKDWTKIVPAAAAFEFLNISSYQANCAFDNKLGVITKAQKDSQIIASMISRELTSRVISELNKDYDAPQLIDIYNSISKSNHYIYLAQHYDLNVLNIKNYKYYQDEKLFLKDYINRCFFGSGVFNGQCAFVGGLLADGKQERLEALRQFGEDYGTALQMINDIGDFIPSDTDRLIKRDFQEQYSDFKNGRLTLPLYHLLRFGNPKNAAKIKDNIHQSCFDEKSLLEVTNMLLDEGSVIYSKEKARVFIKKAEKEIQIFEKSRSKELLLIMASIILTNKYFVALRKVAEQQINIS